MLTFDKNKIEKIIGWVKESPNDKPSLIDELEMSTKYRKIFFPKSDIIKEISYTDWNIQVVLVYTVIYSNKYYK